MMTTSVQAFISDARRIRQSLRAGEVLLVDDELSTTEYLAALCKTIGEKSIRFKNKENAKWHILINHKTIKMAIIDYMLGAETADELIELCQEFMIPCIIHTGRADLVQELSNKYPGLIIVLKSSPIEHILKEMI